MTQFSILIGLFFRFRRRKGEGCFTVGVFKNKSLRLGYQVQLEFSITQHRRDHELLLQFIEFFGCGS